MIYMINSICGWPEPDVFQVKTVDVATNLLEPVLPLKWAD